MAHVFEREIAGKTLRIETGVLAGQASGAVTVRYGDTIVLVTAVASPQPREGIDFFPLTVDYEERLYAAGKIPGSFFRREGRPTQGAILTMRLTDRPLRPLFPKGMRNDVQIIITALSADQENDPDILAIIGASAALAISDIPFNAPVSACRIGFVAGRLVVNPTFQQLDESKLDLVVAGTREAVVMVEAGAEEVTEDILVQAMKMGQIVNGEVIDLIDEMAQAIGKSKFHVRAPEPLPEEVLNAVKSAIDGKLDQVLYRPGPKAEREAGVARVKGQVVERLASAYPADKVIAAFEARLKTEVRQRILEEGVRPDGRKPAEIRPIESQVGLLPRTHGSGLFTRGETQVLTITTLGSIREGQKIDSIGLEVHKRYMHHYNMPPYSTGEAKRIGGAGRREIGHGALAERALLPVVPSEEEFPYAIRLVSEVLSSNGSTSMASVCGSSLSLMDAGVPIKAPVAGVAMGLIQGEGERFAVLTDIQGMEDTLGDMDFKVAGTEAGVTALQMDMKGTGISFAIIDQALAQARESRLFILERMRETIAEVRPELSKYAPRMTSITIDREKIGAIIGPGGRTIRSIIEETKATVDVHDDGTIIIGSTSEEGARRAIEMIESLTKEVEVGAVYTGKVVRIMNFGAFVELLPGKDGMVHISELADHRVGSVEDVVKIGDEIMVMVTEIDRLGRINLSRRAVLEGLGSSGARVRDSSDASDDDRRRPPPGPRGPRPVGDGGPPRGAPRPGGPPRGRGGPPRRGPPRGGPGR
ncbi:MAG: polyribonucleotide nucleotidyltransferase [Dehalococcoidia bacterium]